MVYREHRDSREGFDAATAAEYNEYFDDTELDYDDDDCPDPDLDYDGQPDEYTEWQDYYGGDDWDHGQYDNEY